MTDHKDRQPEVVPKAVGVTVRGHVRITGRSIPLSVGLVAAGHATTPAR